MALIISDLSSIASTSNAPLTANIMTIVTKIITFMNIIASWSSPIFAKLRKDSNAFDPSKDLPKKFPNPSAASPATYVPSITFRVLLVPIMKL